MILPSSFHQKCIMAASIHLISGEKTCLNTILLVIDGLWKIKIERVSYQIKLLSFYLDKIFLINRSN